MSLSNEELLEDWRLMGQMSYLKDETLIWEHFVPPKPGYHEHCDFCFNKFSEAEEDLHYGYHVKGKRYWVCNNCCNDFKSLLNWTIRGGPQQLKKEIESN